MATVARALGAFFCFLGLSLAEAPALVASRDFEIGELGPVVMTTFFTTDIITPRWNIARWDPACNSDALFFLSPHGKELGGRLNIYDQKGNLVYQQPGLTMAPNHNHVVKYKGEDYLVYWEGVELTGLGQGTYYMLNSSYDVVYTIGGLNGLYGDLHAFNITQDQTALFTSYDKMRADLSRFGKPKNSWVWDGAFQEIDIEKNEVIFEWRASHHKDYMDVGQRTIKDPDGTAEKPWDWFHINSVQKDTKGNYLVSARYNNAISYICGKTGEILWELGGRNNSFKDMSEGFATNFFCQHDARFVENETAITLFDNSGYWGHKQTVSRALHIGLDTERMEAKLIQDFRHPFDIRSESQGSHELLKNGHHLIGWGHAAAFSEFAGDGALLCDVHFGSLLFNNKTKQDGEYHFNASGYAQSYRVYKQKWQGFPRWDPAMMFHDNELWVSWNGATEVRTWTLEGGQEDMVLGDDGWSMIQSATKWSFETGIPVDPNDFDAYSAFKLTAINQFGRTLGQWKLNENATIIPPIPYATEVTYSGNIVIPRSYAINGFGFFVVLAILFFFFVQKPRIFNGLYRRLRIAPRVSPVPDSLKNKMNGNHWSD